MNEATKAKIFQPFFTTKPTGQGTEHLVCPMCQDGDSPPRSIREHGTGAVGGHSRDLRNLRRSAGERRLRAHGQGGGCAGRCTQGDGAAKEEGQGMEQVTLARVSGLRSLFRCLVCKLWYRQTGTDPDTLYVPKECAGCKQREIT